MVDKKQTQNKKEMNKIFKTKKKTKIKLWNETTDLIKNNNTDKDEI